VSLISPHVPLFAGSHIQQTDPVQSEVSVLKPSLQRELEVIDLLTDDSQDGLGFCVSGAYIIICKQV